MNRSFNNLMPGLILLILMNYNPAFGQKKCISPEVRVLFTESSGGSDVPRIGSPTGSELHILFSGEYRVYERFYRSDEILTGSGLFPPDQLDSLMRLFKNNNFQNMPDFFPESNRETPNIRWPNHSVTIGLRNSNSDEMKTIHVILTADKKYYSDSFLDFLSRLRSILSPYMKKNQ